MKLDVKCGHIVDKRDMANYKNACSLHDIGWTYANLIGGEIWDDMSMR
jgi:hypothetical protein